MKPAAKPTPIEATVLIDLKVLLIIILNAKPTLIELGRHRWCLPLRLGANLLFDQSYKYNVSL